MIAYDIFFMSKNDSEHKYSDKEREEARQLLDMFSFYHNDHPELAKLVNEGKIDIKKN